MAVSPREGLHVLYYEGMGINRLMMMMNMMTMCKAFGGGGSEQALEFQDQIRDSCSLSRDTPDPFGSQIKGFIHSFIHYGSHALCK